MFDYLFYNFCPSSVFSNCYGCTGLFCCFDKARHVFRMCLWGFFLLICHSQVRRLSWCMMGKGENINEYPIPLVTVSALA